MKSKRTFYYAESFAYSLLELLGVSYLLDITIIKGQIYATRNPRVRSPVVEIQYL